MDVQHHLQHTFSHTWEMRFHSYTEMSIGPNCFHHFAKNNVMFFFTMTLFTEMQFERQKVFVQWATRIYQNVKQKEPSRYVMIRSMGLLAFCA